MFNSNSFLKGFCLFTLFVVIVHFIGETVFTISYNQSLIQTLIDVIAVFLLIFSSLKTLQNKENSGLLCGAWGFEFCLNLRAWAWRFETEHVNIKENIDVTLAILSFLLIISLLSFLITLQMNMKKS